MGHHYDRGFFATQRDRSRQAASVVVPLLVEAIQPRSVIDVGCGVGTWLAQFRDLGIGDVTGIDGDYVERAMLQIPPAQFIAQNLNEPLHVGRRFDLATCLEVGEHLEPERSAGLVHDLVTLAPIVCFGAAVPYQGGTDHLNERWQDEWIEMFGHHGYRAIDLVRPQVWDRGDVAPWYAQNTLVYVAADVSLPAETPVGERIPPRVVHPEMFANRQARVLDIREVLSHARRTARRRLGDSALPTRRT